MKSYISANFDKYFVNIRNGYRPDLDVLRGIAILMVILFHFYPSEYKGGFLGVDVFFVISGFIITKVIYDRVYINASHFLSDFYSRRIKRILPALFVYVVSISILLSLFVYEPFLYLKTGFFALFGFSNLFLASRSTQYFSETTDLNPFAQTWSLGVEEQFYLLYPLLCLLCGFSLYKKRTLFSLLILVLSSVSLYLFTKTADLEKIYFLPQYRFWEIGLGCSLFFAPFHSLIKNIEFKYLQLIKVTSIALIICISVFVSDAKIAIFLTVLTTLLYNSVDLSAFPAKQKNASGSESFILLLSKAFSLFLRHLGLLSYSLYLWHWGVKIIYDWSVSSSSYRGFSLLAITYIVSLSSYLFVETPLRSLKTSPLKTFSYGISYLSVCALFIVVLRKNTAIFYTNQSFSIWGSTSKINPSNCNVSDSSMSGISKKLLECSKTSTSSSKIDIFILGDSHSRHHLPLAKKLSENFGATAQYLHVRCGNSSFPGLFEGSSESSFDSQACSESLLKYLSLNTDSSDIIILSSRWLSNIYPGIYDFHTNKSYGISIDAYPNKLYSKDAYTHLISQLSDLVKGIKPSAIGNRPTVIFMSSIPDFPDFLSKPPSELLGYCESKRLFGKDIMLSHLCYSEPSFINRSIVLERENFLKQLVQTPFQNTTNFIYFDQFGILCPPNQEACSTHLSNGTPLFSDDDHLSREASEMIAEVLYTTLKLRSQKND